MAEYSQQVSKFRDHIIDSGGQPQFSNLFSTIEILLPHLSAHMKGGRWGSQIANKENQTLVKHFTFKGLSHASRWLAGEMHITKTDFVYMDLPSNM